MCCWFLLYQVNYKLDNIAIIFIYNFIIPLPAAYSQEVVDESLDLDDVTTISSTDESEATTEDQEFLTTTYRPRPPFPVRHPHHKKSSHRKPQKHINKSVKNHSDEHQFNDIHPKQNHSNGMHSNDDLHLDFSKDHSNEFHSYEESSKESLSDRIKSVHDSLAEGSGDSTYEEHRLFSPRT